jgi:hypothetical protein
VNLFAASRNDREKVNFGLCYSGSDSVAKKTYQTDQCRRAIDNYLLSNSAADDQACEASSFEAR